MIDQQPTCPAMAHLWQKLQEDKAILTLYQTSGLFRAAFHSDLPIEQLILLYEQERERLMAENARLGLKIPHVYQLEGADPDALETKTRALHVSQSKLTLLANLVADYLNLPNEPNPEEVINHLYKVKAIKENQD